MLEMARGDQCISAVVARTGDQQDALILVSQ